ncbi:hypothetical protein Pcinc_006174 [Petrolisthes cinctipes]|uniref:G-protein coupled receptors family 1 profile domain-containing protein n=1 Tax=Petrolisthes cinctipes TaxID=88211 RepID=A0AAE1GHV7_PETCI|nr:hypothetical protein Pcinc_006174 [Petrolisthes cinctipes]
MRRTNSDSNWNEMKMLALRVFLVVATDALCWLPIIFLGILSISGVDIPPSVFSWTAVFILPINSVINPILYTFTSRTMTNAIYSLRNSICHRRQLYRNSSGSTGLTFVARNRETTRREIQSTTPRTVIARISNVVAKWPGSVHDSRIWNECGLSDGFRNETVPGGCHLIGDSGYPYEPWLLTPYLQPRTEAQEAYNRAHKCTRCVVERGIGQLKKRFHVLHGEIRVSPAKTTQFVMICATLHKLCKERNLELPDQQDIGLQDEISQTNTTTPSLFCLVEFKMASYTEIILPTFTSNLNSEQYQGVICPTYLLQE